MKKELAFMTAISENIAFAAGNIAIALDKYIRNMDYDFLVFCPHLNENDANALKKINNSHFVKWRPNNDLVMHLLKNLPEKCPYVNKNKLMLLGHHEIYNLLDEYKTVVWLDADILVQGDLTSIIQYAPFGITSDDPWMVRSQFAEPQEADIHAPKYNLNKPAFCAAVMIVNDELPYKDMYSWIIEKTYYYAPYIKNVAQVPINLMLQEFKILPNILPLEIWQCMPWKQGASTAKIVHFGTGEKVWNTSKLLKQFSEWYRNHLVWLELGGSDFPNRNSLI